MRGLDKLEIFGVDFFGHVLASGVSMMPQSETRYWNSI